MIKPAQLAELRSLSDLIASAVNTIEQAASGKNPTQEHIADIQQQCGLMLAAVARGPHLTLVVNALKFHASSCLRTAINLHVAEILRGAGTGLHAKDIAAPTLTDPEKLERVLRVLAMHHIFKEISPHVFANNEASSLLDTGKNIQDLISCPESKHDGVLGMTALLEHMTDHGMKASAYRPDALVDSDIARLGEANRTAFNLAMQTDLSYFSWLERTENAYQRKRFGRAMTSMPDAVEGFDWQSLPKDSVVVDVGGGIGSQSLVLAKTFNHLKFVIQDRASVLDEGVAFWNSRLPGVISSGRVTLQAHDFFTEQPVANPAVFMLRAILHDLSDEYCVQILTRLRAASGPNTQLVVIEHLITHTCSDPDNPHDIPGAPGGSFPAPTLANGGEAGIIVNFADIEMMSLLNGSERTVTQFRSLYEQSGWKLSQVFVRNAFWHSHAKIVGVPA